MTLIIYDTTGRVLVQAEGAIEEPVGVPFIWVDIPVGNVISSVDVSVTPNEAIYKELPKSEMQLQLELLQDAVNDLILGGATL